MPADPSRPDRQARFFGDVLGFGWVLPASIAAGAGLGWLADKVVGIFPVLTIALGLAGVAAGLRQIYRESETLSRPARATGRPRRDGAFRPDPVSSSGGPRYWVYFLWPPSRLWAFSGPRLP